MKKTFLPGLVILLGTGLLLAGCYSKNGQINGTNPGQFLNQSTNPAEPGPAQVTPAGANTIIDQAGVDANQALNDLQSTLQGQDVSTPSSSGDQNLNDTAQGLDNLLQTIQAEPTP